MLGIFNYHRENGGGPLRINPIYTLVGICWVYHISFKGLLGGGLSGKLVTKPVFSPGSPPGHHFLHVGFKKPSFLQ